MSWDFVAKDSWLNESDCAELQYTIYIYIFENILVMTRPQHYLIFKFVKNITVEECLPARRSRVRYLDWIKGLVWVGFIRVFGFSEI